MALPCRRLLFAATRRLGAAIDRTRRKHRGGWARAVLLVSVVACGPTRAQLEAIKYAPQQRGDWEISTPEREGLDPLRVAELVYDAEHLETIHGVLVVKNDRLVAERYFNGSNIDDAGDRMSTTKSFVSALAGIAVQRGCLRVDQRMTEFFPEYAKDLSSTPKAAITVEHLLQMRAGYPWEGLESPYMEKIFLEKNYNWAPHVVDFPLTRATGKEFGYSNLTSHLLGIAIARGCETDLLTFARANLFAPMKAELPRWHKGTDGFHFGAFGIHVTARDMAKFGSVYLHQGRFRGVPVVPAAWVQASLRRYSEGINFTGWLSSELGDYFHDLGYGYQWWSASAGDQRFDFAWGHGGNLIVLHHGMKLIVVTSADPLYDYPESAGWKYEGAIIDVVGKYLASLSDTSPK